MSRLLSSGFEDQLVGTSAEWGVVFGTAPTISTSVKHGGAASLRISGLVSASRQGVLSRFIATGPRIAYARTYFRVDTASSATNAIFGFGNADTSPTLVNIRLTAARTLALYNNTTLIATGTTVLTLGTFYRLELMYARDAATPNASLDVAELRINGVTELNPTTLSISAVASRFSVGGNLHVEAQTAGEWFHDDVAVNDTAGTFQTSWPDKGRIVHLYPHAAGDFDQSLTLVGGPASGFDAWEDGGEGGTRPPFDDATSYAEFGTNSTTWTGGGSRVAVALQDPVGAGLAPADVITLVQAIARGSNDSSSTGSVVATIKSGVSQQDSGALVWSSSTWSSGPTSVPRTPFIAYVDPATAVAWTVTGLGTIQLGARATDITPPSRISTMYALVEYVTATVAAVTAVPAAFAWSGGPSVLTQNVTIVPAGFAWDGGHAALTAHVLAESAILLWDGDQLHPTYRVAAHPAEFVWVAAVSRLSTSVIAVPARILWGVPAEKTSVRVVLRTPAGFTWAVRTSGTAGVEAYPAEFSWGSPLFVKLAVPDIIPITLDFRRTIQLTVER